MAFGFGFNKQKVLNTAEKFVQQGKLQSAITEYEKVLKNDSKDLTVQNTVGDLYSRLGNSERAVECFKSVGDAYASQGFTVKAIAMYKKLSKLKSSLETVLRLAELYTQQGLFNDARAQYLQVAEEFLRSGELEQAVRIFQKTLEMDPENVAMRTKLAEVYVRLNKKTEAWQIFSAAAETLRSKGQLEAAEEILQRMLKLDPSSSYALLLRGRNSFDNGDMAGVIQCLEKVADLDSNPDGLRILLQAYLQTSRFTEAGTVATKLLSVHNDVAAVLSYAETRIAAGQFEEALQMYQQHCERLLAADSGKMLETLHSLIGHVRENPAALEILLDLLNKAGDTTHITEVYELLAHAYVQSGQLESARDYYLKLTQLEPENQIHARNYQQVLGRLGTPGSTRLITPEEGAVLVDELEATAPFIDQRYADEVALAVRAALTDAELFISYNMPAKALGPLLAVLPQAPADLRINQRLAALHTRAGRFTEAAVCCRTLESLYHEAGYPDEATRYGDLAGKYEERAAAMTVEPRRVQPPAKRSVALEAPAAIDVAEPPLTTDVAVVSPDDSASERVFHAEASAVSEADHASEEFDVQPAPPAEDTIDLSAEWEGELSPRYAPRPAAKEQTVEASATADNRAAINEEGILEAWEEIRFYLGNGMVEEARTAFRKLEQLGPDPSRLAAIRAELEAALAKPATPAEEVTVEETDTFVEPEAASASQPTPGGLDTFVSDLESSLGDGFLPQTHEVAPEPQIQAKPEYAHAQAEPQPVGHLKDLVSNLEDSLGESFLAEAPVAQTEPPAELKPEKQPETVPAEAVASVPAPVARAAAAAQSASAPPSFSYQPTPIRPLAPEWPGATNSQNSSAAGVDLATMFGELKQELEEDSATAEEDPETHYNLGIAFREMGLLDEAIGELQKVCQAVDRGHPFPQIMQTYTWLSQCFLDKGVPEAAVRWYEKALQIPTLDQDTRTALHYELASSYQTAGNKSAALNHFMEVYGSNIDYRDVAERIKTLKS